MLPVMEGGVEVLGSVLCLFKTPKSSSNNNETRSSMTPLSSLERWEKINKWSTIEKGRIRGFQQYV
jgi:hypothetical protein